MKKSSMIPLRYISVIRNVIETLETVILAVGNEAEVCGLLAGVITNAETAVATAVYPLSNLSLRKNSFAVDVEEFCRERDAIEQKGLVPLALYHSHIDGPTTPSFRDRKLPWITDLPLLILSLGDGKLRFGCYDNVVGKMVPISFIPGYDSDANPWLAYHRRLHK
jgi:proteasome lid subunit RPN8/RPN11